MAMKNTGIPQDLFDDVDQMDYDEDEQYANETAGKIDESEEQEIEWEGDDLLINDEGFEDEEY